MVMCMERNMVKNRVCSDVVREICNTLNYPRLPYLGEIGNTVIKIRDDMEPNLYLATNGHVQFQLIFCKCCGNYVIHQNLELEVNTQYDCVC